jgi:hypothetical protein
VKPFVRTGGCDPSNGGQRRAVWWQLRWRWVGPGGDAPTTVAAQMARRELARLSNAVEADEWPDVWAGA